MFTLTKDHARLAKFAAREESRYAIRNIMIHHTGTVCATDGRRAAYMTCDVNDAAHNIAIESDQFADVVGKAKKHVVVTNGVPQRVRLSDGRRIVELADEPGGFPDVSAVLPREIRHSIAVNAKMLAELLSAVPEQPDSLKPIVHIGFNEASQPMAMWSRGPGGTGAYVAILMPVKSDGPSWQEAKSELFRRPEPEWNAACWENVGGPIFCTPEPESSNWAYLYDPPASPAATSNSDASRARFGLTKAERTVMSAIPKFEWFDVLQTWGGNDAPDIAKRQTVRRLIKRGLLERTDRTDTFVVRKSLA